MNTIRDRVRRGEIVTGTFLNLASSFTAEIAGRAGFDWVLIDLEHGLGDDVTLAHQLQALAATPTCALVRVASNDPVRLKRVLDMGAAGVMVPYVSTPEEAMRAASGMRFPPKGTRGVNRSNRACGFGQQFQEYFATVEQRLLTIIQIESEDAISNINELASVDGIDVLFVGPLDLSVSLGVPEQWDHSKFREAIVRTVEACRREGKAAGMHAIRPDQLGQIVADGFTFIGLGTESTTLAASMKGLADSLNRIKSGKVSSQT